MSRVSNCTPGKSFSGTVMGERPVAMASRMPFACSLCRVSSIRGVTCFFSMSMRVPSMSKKMIFGLCMVSSFQCSESGAEAVSRTSWMKAFICGVSHLSRW